MNIPDRHRKSQKKGTIAVRLLAVLALTGLVSLFATPMTAGAIAGSITLSPSVQYRAVLNDTLGNTAQITATVVGAITSVTFTVTGANSASATVPVSSGTAVFTYNGALHGTDTVNATDNTNTVNATPVTVYWSELDVSPTSVNLAVGTDATFNFQLYYPTGSVVSQKIYYTVTGTASANCPATSGYVTTDGIGGGTASLTCTGTNPGSVTIVAWADVYLNDQVQQARDPSAPHITATWSTSNITLTPSNIISNVGTTATLTATVTDGSSNPINGADVHFEYDTPHVNSPSSLDTFTNSNGTATYSYSGSNVGQDTITACVDLNHNNQCDSGEPTTSVTVTWVNIALSLTPSSQTATVGGQASFTATVSGTPSSYVSGALVRYSVTGVNSASSYAFANSSGVATFSYTGHNTGSDTVTVYVDLNSNGTRDAGEPQQTATVSWSSGTLALAPATQSVTVNTQATLTATATTGNTPVSGVIIRYTVTGANPTSGSATTNASGVATINYTGTHTGTDTVTAYEDLNNNSSKDSGEPSATATVTWTLTATLTLTPTTTTPGVGTTSYTAVSLTTTNGGVPGIPIRYTVTGANPTSGSMTTAGNGQTVISYNGNNAGTDTLSAYADMNNNGQKDSGEPTASVTITWGGTTPPPPPVTPTTFEPALPASPKAGCTYFAATQHNLCAGFQAYWNQFGGLGPYGMPLTEEFVENGVTVQYFERAVFEWRKGQWPSHYDVTLRLLGDEITAGRGNEAPFQRAQANNSSGCEYFAVTGHNVCGAFLQYWNAYGGLNNNGYPISEAFQEKNPDTGVVYTVQYFERVRMELHPGGWPSHYNIFLGRLGAEMLDKTYGTAY